MKNPAIALENRYSAHNYSPLPVVLSSGRGVWLMDETGKHYLDMMSAYSAVSFGHSNPTLVAALTRQANRLAVTSRAFYTDQLGPFLQLLCEMTGQPKALPMNSGAEAVETALKAARKWGHKVKGIPDNSAEIIVCKGNFGGRTTTIIGFSSEPQYRDGFGPFPSGFVSIPFGDAAALEAAITPRTAAFLVEPIQGEGGIIVPPDGYLAACREICTRHNVLLICDEVQTGLGRTGKLLACDHENVVPDGLILGKALGGGLLPVSAFLAREDVMAVFTPGDHGSTFGGNPLAAAVGHAALSLLRDDHLAAAADRMGQRLQSGLRAMSHPAIRAVRGKGLLIGMELDPSIISARAFCEILLELGMLSKDTHETVVRFAPPLIISASEIDTGLNIIRKALEAIPSVTAPAERSYA
ncbi:ornithine--oxo-acid transaminase [Glaciimonas sp. CA11.2]|uniref:ornithine--oxo-acid transaminase n=1 Tax=unclassified Glaciimonas TaxID=2644401 RepID=UPI002AB43222|nr:MULTISPECIES: ornithine--oxo-acid transaminase [unclassified Glaciimonas]MDY7546254.1 ornithine--oxo-acid transaminase [Glaciimonas sp. CA11.2]MEB0010797.1 ornithine--oxo-acid transaminase [Glaciimonas sp. Cout2]MEB0082067.1 ornithine--oxo-acid transaminase [Glaciimonas sp. Gout2]MEB0162144.1 ornithine--oxo-acid transaminase [Glaciimonas sp. CA11.2]